MLSIIIKIGYWSSHHNMFLYSAFYYSKIKNVKIKIEIDQSIHSNGIRVEFNGNSYYFDINGY